MVVSLKVCVEKYQPIQKDNKFETAFWKHALTKLEKRQLIHECEAFTLTIDFMTAIF